MSKEEGVNNQKLLITFCTVLFIYNLFITAVVGWLVVKTERHEAKIEELERRKPVESVLDDPSQSVEHNLKLKRREVLNAGSSTNLIDLLKKGIRGPPGLPGKDGRDGRDAVNFDSINYRINKTIVHGVGIEMARIQTLIKQIPTVSGALYIRWGKTSCPSTARLLSKGIASGTSWNLRGGGSQHLCLPDDPEYHPKATTPQRVSRISGVEYEYPVDALFGRQLFTQNAPCVYCQTNNRSQRLMLPAKMKCPTDWTMEYQGYLMTEPTHSSERNRNSFVCVDRDAEPLPGQGHNTNGAIWNHVAAHCTTGEGALGYCPPYKADIPLSCVVCSM